MSKKIFSTPEEVFAGQFNRPQFAAITYVEAKLKANEFQFKPPYAVSQYAHPLISDLLRESGWGLDVDAEGNWLITKLL